MVSEKQPVMYKGTPIRTLADFSAETLQDRREWNNIFKVIQGKNLQSRVLYLSRLSFRFEGEIKIFTGKQKLKVVSTMKSALQEMLKGLL